MKNLETVLAVFYNFKDESTCPFCKLVKAIYDQGGRELVAQQLATKFDSNYRHNFLVCFIQHYWIDEVYQKEKNRRPLDTVVKEGLEVFNHFASILSIK